MLDVLPKPFCARECNGCLATNSKGTISRERKDAACRILDMVVVFSRRDALSGGMAHGVDGMATVMSAFP